MGSVGEPKRKSGELLGQLRFSTALERGPKDIGAASECDVCEFAGVLSLVLVAGMRLTPVGIPVEPPDSVLQGTPTLQVCFLLQTWELAGWCRGNPMYVVSMR